MSTKTILDSIKQLTVVELSELVKAIEEEFGVSAAAPVAMAVAAPVAGGAEKAAEAKNEYKVNMKSAGDQKIKVIKALRTVFTELGLKEAKDMVDGAPCVVAEAMPTKNAEELKKALEEAGATVELV
jgi:large subunit ribosomal protein L7/L12